MDLNNLALYKLLTRKMDWLTHRQETLAKNIANSDTPDYKPNDLKPFTFRDALADSRRLKASTTEPSHMQGTIAAGGLNPERRVRNPYETAPDGNAVVIEEQIMKVSQNAMDYQTMTNLYRKQIAMLKMALGRGGA